MGNLTKYSNKPAVPSETTVKDFESVRKWMGQVRQLLEIHEGTRGQDDIDRFVRVGELSLLVPQEVDFVDIITSDDGAPNPPTNFSATKRAADGSASFKIYLSWTNPKDEDLDCVEIVYCTSNNRNACLANTIKVYPGAAMLGQTSTHEFLPASPTFDYYFWIRAVDLAGNVSIWNPESATAGLCVEGETTLGEWIDQIMAVLRGAGAPAYDPAITYYQFDVVSYGGFKYQVYNDNGGVGITGIIPTNVTYWRITGLVLEGLVDGIPTVGIDGRLVVDQTIYARSIVTDGLIVGDNITIADGAITINALATDTSGWISGIESNANQALADAVTAQETADGKIVTFYQTYAPSGSLAHLGDLWFDTNDNYKVYRWSGSAWLPVQDLGIAQAISDAADAQATADGKITTYFSSTVAIPTAEAVGDLWYATNTGVLYRAAIAGANEIKAGEWEPTVDKTSLNTAKDIIYMPQTPTSTPGFYNNGSYMGFHNGTNWTIYFRNNISANRGEFYFKGDATNYLQWDGTTLQLSTDKSNAIVILNGGDIVLNASTTNPGEIVFTGAAGDVTLNSYQGGVVYMHPKTHGIGSLVFGSNNSGSLKSYAVNLYGSNNIRITGNTAFLYLETHATIGKAFWADAHFVPNATATYDLGFDNGSIIRRFRNLKLSGSIDCAGITCTTFAPSGEVANFSMGAGGQITVTGTMVLANSTVDYSFGTTSFWPARATDETIDLGVASYSWEQFYCKNVNETADFYFMDDWINPDTGIKEELDDIAIIEAIAPGQTYDPVTGLLLIDDDTLHLSLLSRYSKTVEEKDKNGNILFSYAKGEIARNHEGKPYLASSKMFSLLMGSVRKLNAKVKAAEEEIVKMKQESGRA